MASITIHKNSDALDLYVTTTDSGYLLHDSDEQTLRSSFETGIDFVGVLAERLFSDLVLANESGTLAVNEVTTTAIELETDRYRIREEGVFAFEGVSSTAYSEVHTLNLLDKTTGAYLLSFDVAVFADYYYGFWSAEPDLQSSTWGDSFLRMDNGVTLSALGSGNYDSNDLQQGTYHELTMATPIDSQTSIKSIYTGDITEAQDILVGATFTNVSYGIINNANPETYTDFISVYQPVGSLDSTSSDFLSTAGNDEIFLTGTFAAEGNGGDGNDTITSGAASDRLVGGAGDDIMFSPVDFSDRDIFSPALLDNLLYVTSMLDNYRKNENSHRATGRSL